MLPRITVRKMLIDGKQWAEWRPYALPLGPGLVATWTPAGTDMLWATGKFEATYNAIHYWWRGARYLIGAQYLGVEFAGCYCDVSLPLPDLPSDAPERAFVDLYLDLVVRPDRTWYTKDQEIYDRAERLMPALAQERPAAEAALRELERYAPDWSGPFARVPATLPRTDWHLLDPASAEYARAIGELHA
jgi:hypothetical protein